MSDSKIDYLLASPGYLPGKVLNPWIGCDQHDEHGNIREGCRYCWARSWAERTSFARGCWGSDAPRHFMGEDYWQQPLRWQKECEREGKRMRVLGGAMCDVFERLPFAHAQVARLAEERRRLWDLIADTPMLDWLVLTKRPENMGTGSLPAEPGTLGKHGRPVMRVLPNLWLGASIWDQPSGDRNIPLLLEVPAALHWVSYEPALGPVDLRHLQTDVTEIDALTGSHGVLRPHRGRSDRRLGWVVAGCESRGPRPGRPCDWRWVERLAKQCKEAGIPMWTKQLPDIRPGMNRIVKSTKLAREGWPTQLPDTRLLAPQRAQEAVSRGGRAASRTGRSPA